MILQHISLPLYVIKRQRPDFKFEPFGQNDGIGLEHTSAANQPWEDSTHQFFPKAKNPEYGCVSRNWLEGITKEGRELRNFVAGKQGAPSIWSARDHAKSKVDEVIHAIQEKSEKLNKGLYEQYRENWLLISDRNPFLFLDLSCFEEHIIRAMRTAPFIYNRIFFITVLFDKKRNLNTDFHRPINRHI